MDIKTKIERCLPETFALLSAFPGALGEVIRLAEFEDYDDTGDVVDLMESMSLCVSDGKLYLEQYMGETLVWNGKEFVEE